ncbi:hypothetical protein R6Q59_029329 [Mikania micrantha]
MTTPAQIPTSFGHELLACLRCRFVKSYHQKGQLGHGDKIQRDTPTVVSALAS